MYFIKYFLFALKVLLEQPMIAYRTFASNRMRKGRFSSKQNSSKIVIFLPD